MGYPVGPLLQELAQRILANLDLIDDLALATETRGMDQKRPPYTDTQLLISLLGVLVFPHERTNGALGRLLSNYDGLSRVVAIRYSAAGPGRVEITGSDGERETVDPTSIRNLPKLLRNGIAHFNIRPIERNGSFAGIRVWNKDDSEQITLVADLDFSELRPLARYILNALAEAKSDLRLDDPPDPLELLAHTRASTADKPKAPRIIDYVWKRVLESHNGDACQAKQFVDRILRDASQQGRVAPRPVQS
jgi:HEPN pEK499 p136